MLFASVVHLLKPNLRAVARQKACDLSDPQIVAAILESPAEGAALLFDRYGAYIEKLLYRVVGSDTELEDLLHDVFADALSNVSKIREPSSLKPWLTRVAVFAARSHIRKKSRGRWLHFRAPSEIPEQSCEPTFGEVETSRRVYACLARINADDRLAFTLRMLHEMSLPEVAAACDVSLATAKRRIAKGRAAFHRQASLDPVLRERTEGRS